jgi:hypothetical protein
LAKAISANIRDKPSIACLPFDQPRRRYSINLDEEEIVIIGAKAASVIAAAP